jgi:hypothetical protein
LDLTVNGVSTNQIDGGSFILVFKFLKKYLNWQTALRKVPIIYPPFFFPSFFQLFCTNFRKLFGHQLRRKGRNFEKKIKK